MKLYKANAVLLAIACIVSGLPTMALADDAQPTAKEETTEGDDSTKGAKEQNIENNKSQNQLSDKSKKGTIKNSANKNQTDKLSSGKKTGEKESTENETAEKNKQTESKKQKENQDLKKAELTGEEAEKQIPITSIGDFQKIGTEGYPLDGVYVLQNDIDGRNMESGENTETEPLITSEEPFAGVINGGGHTIANLTIKRADEGEKNTSMFGVYSGRLEEINFLNIQVVSERHSGALIAEKMDGAQLKNIVLSGNVTLSKSEELSEQEQKQRVAATIALQADGEKWKEFLKNKEQKTTFSSVKAATGIDDLSENLPEGLSEIQTNPEYLSTVEGIEETIEAPKLEGFTFLKWTVENREGETKQFEGKITNSEELKTKITGKEGKYRLKAAYFYELNNVESTANTTNNIQNQKSDVGNSNANSQNQTADTGEDNTSQFIKNKHTAELVIEVPYIVGKDIKNIEKLIPIDNVFPKQIRATMYLDAIDGVFPKYMEVGKKTDGETIDITSWEQFKNIGNTDYNPHYSMNANYVLKANIYSDGKEFTPIGTEENPFTGSFDGNGFEIDVSRNPEIGTNADYSGLFGAVKSQKQEADAEKSKEVKSEKEDTSESKNETEVKSEEEITGER